MHKKIIPFVKLLDLILITIAIFLARDIHLILFFTILTIILVLMTNKNVNVYISTIKKTIIWLLFILIVYIMLCGSLANTLLFFYKLILVLIIIKVFDLNMNLRQIGNGLYTMLYPLNKLKINLQKLVINITVYIVFLKELINSKTRIIETQKTKGLKKYNFKNYFIPRLVYSIEEAKSLENSFKIGNYKLRVDKFNFISGLICILSVIMFIIVLFKEVI